jgi:hypothetical protein
MRDWPVARHLYALATQAEKIPTSMPQVAFEPTIPISHTYQHMHKTKLYISLYCTFLHVQMIIVRDLRTKAYIPTMH